MFSAWAHADIGDKNPTLKTPLFKLSWCQTNYCREVELRQAQEDWEGALDMLDHITSDRNDKLAGCAYFGVALINAQLQRPREALSAWARYNQFIQTIDDKLLPLGMRRLQVEKLRTSLIDMVGHIELEGGPHHAEVILDERSIGQLPLSAVPSVNPGMHHLAITTPSGTSVTLDVLVQAGATRTVNVDREFPWPLPPPQPVRIIKEPPSVTRRVVAGAFVAAGVVGIGVGIGLLAIHQLCPGDLVRAHPAMAMSEELSCYPDGFGGYYNTLTLGSVVLSSGAVALFSGILLGKISTHRTVGVKVARREALSSNNSVFQLALNF